MSAALSRKTGKYLLDGPAGALEVHLEAPREARRPLSAALVCHPHPLYGGSMDNKVAYMLASAFRQLGAYSLRFNFRGVGRSAGGFDHGQGESEDVLFLAEHLYTQCAVEQLWLAGFSFGAYTALRAHQAAKARCLVLAAPPLRRFPCKDAPADIPVLVIQGGRDEIVAASEVETWLDTLPRRPDYHFMPEAEHFFHGHLPRLRDTVMTWCEEKVLRDSPRGKSPPHSRNNLF